MSKKSINIVCYANYCRSPAAEQILRNIHQDKFEFQSSGLNPLIKSNMDPRSVRFLEQNKIRNTLHIPKKINLESVMKNDLILALDIEILLALNKSFPLQKKKIKLITYQNPKIKIQDPYHLSDEEYYKVMEKLLSVCKDLKL
tara:strand:- start:96 stop:524 length:429 start_codon:yes stop_codon:yes gene_type:complete